MSDWPGWGALVVSLATASRGEYLRLRANVASRGALSDDVVSMYDTSDLFKLDLPDFDAGGLVNSANKWKEKCRLAQLAVSSLSSAHRNLGICISSVTHFRDEAHRKILSKSPDRHDDQPLYVYGSDQVLLKKLISDLVEGVSASVQSLRSPRPRRFGRPGS